MSGRRVNSVDDLAAALVELHQRLTVTEQQSHRHGGVLLGSVERGTYTPTLRNIAIGTGGSAALAGAYTWVGGPNVGDSGIIVVTGHLKFGTSGQTFPPGSYCGVALPSGFQMETDARAYNPVGNCWVGDGLTNPVPGQALYEPGSGGDEFYFQVNRTDATYASGRNVATGVPFAWAAGYEMRWHVSVDAIRV